MSRATSDRLKVGPNEFLQLESPYANWRLLLERDLVTTDKRPNRLTKNVGYHPLGKSRV